MGKEIYAILYVDDLPLLDTTEALIDQFGVTKMFSDSRE
jgi:hypothetical protein